MGGITLFDCTGALPTGVSTWQFNFQFNLDDEYWSQSSISMLRDKAKIDFDKHKTHGIHPEDFAELMFTSGLVLLDNVTWLAFHSAYDFGYLWRQLCQRSLPSTEEQFLDDLKTFFPNIYDIKYLMQYTHNLHGGLKNVAKCLEVERIGVQHQAGSDSLLSGKVFFKMCRSYFPDSSNLLEHCGQISGFQNHH